MTVCQRPSCFRSIKYKGLVFHDPDSGNDFCIWQQNMESCCGRGNEWFLLGVCTEDGVEDEAFMLELACKMIGETPQKDGIPVVRQEFDQEQEYLVVE
jgi:hypothetical protein